MNTPNTKYPPGHFYSPVVDPSTVRNYVDRLRRMTPDQLSGIDIDLSAMTKFWEEAISTVKVDFSRTPSEQARYHYSNESFGLGDAFILSAMISRHRPQRIVEIGGGFSSACMLDCLERLGLETSQLTIIDPYPERLRKLLRQHDLGRTQVLSCQVQDVDLNLFRQLKRGDILFIDSTHVLKTGSDVHYELTQILPVLSVGVLVHFHDIQFPFEYPDAWIFDENLSWNEAYALHLFLMYNPVFRVIFFNNLFGRIRNDLVTAQFPDLGRFPAHFGGSLWLISQRPEASHALAGPLDAD